jgi:ATP-binding cassette subfamily C (CFTR/MRP) protein 1
MDKTVISIVSVIAHGVLISLASGYLAIAIPACVIVLALIQTYYLRTSRQLRLLDIEAKAPLFSQLLETLNGVLCIRGVGWTHKYMQSNQELLDASQKPYYLLWCIQRWLALVLDLFVAGVAVLLVALATTHRSSSTAFLGVAMYNVVSFSSTLQKLVTEWTQLETAMSAINRIRSYVSNTASEDLDSETSEPPESWLSKGEIEFADVSAAFQGSQEPVLRQITFSILPGEKVALCGRTGR